MKQTFTFKRLFVAAFFLLTAASQSLANEDEIIWVKAEAYPTGAGTVYTNYANRDNDGNDIAKTFEATSEFKRYTNGAITTSYIWAQVDNNDYQLAGFARDTNKNGIFDNDTNTDSQVKVDFDGYFKGVPYPETIQGQSTTDADEKAAEALAEKTEPSDLVFAVFTKGAIAVMAAGQEAFGHIWTSKLSTEVGDQVHFLAYGDEYQSKYYKFDHWENAAGQNVGTDRLLTVTVQGKEVYYAVVVETDKETFKADEKDPHVSDSQSGEFPWESGIKTVNSGNVDNTVIYDLQGRRVAQPVRGMFIQNGKKIVVK